MNRPIISLLLLLMVGATTQPSTQPAASDGSLHVSWLVVATPDEEARKLGLKEFATTIRIARGELSDSTFHTRAGCIAGGYPPAKASWYSTYPNKSFTAKCEVKEEGGISVLEWKGVLSEHRITGEVMLAIAGPRHSTEEIDKLLEPARQSLLRETPDLDVRGVPVNAAVIEALKRDIERGRLAFTAPGRTLRFTFETKQTNIDVTGNWEHPAAASQPSQTQVPPAGVNERELQDRRARARSKRQAQATDAR